MYHGCQIARQIAVADWGFVPTVDYYGCFKNMRCATLDA